MIKKSKIHDNNGNPNYLIGLDNHSFVKYFLKKNESGYYEFWDINLKLEDLDYKTIEEPVLTEKKFKKLKEILFIYTTCKNAGIMHRTIPRFKDNERACDYEMIESEMEDEISKLLEP